jgi:hypothetical protein
MYEMVNSSPHDFAVSFCLTLILTLGHRDLLLWTRIVLRLWLVSILNAIVTTVVIIIVIHDKVSLCQALNNFRVSSPSQSGTKYAATERMSLPNPHGILFASPNADRHIHGWNYNPTIITVSSSSSSSSSWSTFRQGSLQQVGRIPTNFLE